MPTQLLRGVFRFPVLARLWPYLLVLTVYTLLVEWVSILTAEPDGKLGTSRPGELLLGSLLFGWFMAFRARYFLRAVVRGPLPVGDAGQR